LVSAALGSRIIFRTADSSTSFCFADSFFFLRRPRGGLAREESACGALRRECVRRWSDGTWREETSSSQLQAEARSGANRESSWSMLCSPSSDSMKKKLRGFDQIRQSLAHPLRMSPRFSQCERSGRLRRIFLDSGRLPDSVSEGSSGFPQLFRSSWTRIGSRQPASISGRAAEHSQRSPPVKTKTLRVMRIYATSWKGHGNFACKSQLIETMQQSWV